jgi:hypothetical protein
MRVPSEMYEVEETAARERERNRWLAVSEPFPVDDDPDWEQSTRELWLYEPAA